MCTKHVFFCFTVIFISLTLVGKATCEDEKPDLAKLFAFESRELYHNIKKFQSKIAEKDRIDTLAGILEIASTMDSREAIRKGVICYLMRDYVNKWHENTGLEVQVLSCINSKDDDLRTVVFNLIDKSYPAYQMRPFVLIYLADKNDFNRSNAISNVKNYEDRVKILESYIRQNNGIEEFQKSVSEAKDLLKNNFYGSKLAK